MWAEIISIFVGIVVITITTIFGVRYSKLEAKIDVRPNAPLLEIRAERIKPHTDNYTRGIIKNQKERKNGTTFIEFYPSDVEQGETIPRPDIKSFITKSEYIKRGAEGDGTRRQLVTILPRDITDLPRSMRNTIEGKELAKEGQIAYLEATFGKMIPEGDEAIAEAMKRYARGNIRKAIIKEMDAEAKKLRSIIPPVQAETKPTESKT